MKKLLATLLVVPAIAHAEFMNGNMLLQKMTSTSSSEKMFALGYVVGVSDLSQGKAHCSGQQVTAGQAHDVVKMYIEKNPSVRDMTADVLAVIALGEAFPCPKQNKPSGRGA